MYNTDDADRSTHGGIELDPEVITVSNGAPLPLKSTRKTGWSTAPRDLVAQTPQGLDLHCIVDNLSAHGTEAVETFLDEHPQVFLHNTPTHASWLNQVELFFSIMQRRLIRYGEFDSIDDLAERIIAFINDYNRRATPFRWTYDGRLLRVA